MTINLSKWKKDWSLMDTFFTYDEINTIKKKLQNLEIEYVVFCSFESRFARSGGLAAVTTRILPYLKKRKQVKKVILMTPYYPHIIEENQLIPGGIKPFEVIFNGKLVKVDLYKYISNGSSPNNVEIEEFYLKAEGFFEANNKINDPYGYFQYNSLRNDSAIRENALFFCKTVPYAVKAIGITENIVFHLQEWQTTLITLSAKKAMIDGTLLSCGTVQTMHNPFDSWIPRGMLKKMLGEKKRTAEL